MSPVVYLLLGSMILLVIGAWLLRNAIRHADAGFENESGFHFGDPVAVNNAVPRPRRQRGGSRAPMPIAHQAAMERHDASSRKGRRNKKTGDSNPPIHLGKQAAFPNMFG